MTKNEILMELDLLVNDVGFDFSQLIVIGKAAGVLNGREDPTMENIEIWVNPNYYKIIASDDDYVELPCMKDGKSVRSIGFAYYYYDKKYGETRLYSGDVIGPKPKSKLINGFNAATTDPIFTRIK